MWRSRTNQTWLEMRLFETSIGKIRQISTIKDFSMIWRETKSQKCRPRTITWIGRNDSWLTRPIYSSWIKSEISRWEKKRGKNTPKNSEYRCKLTMMRDFGRIKWQESKRKSTTTTCRPINRMIRITTHRYQAGAEMPNITISCWRWIKMQNQSKM